MNVSEPSKIYKLRTDNVVNGKQRIPLYDIEAVAGLVPLFQDIQNQDPIDHISIPQLPKCDGAVKVTGDSMYPLLKSGDIIMYKQIHDIENDIFWGEMYLLSVGTDDEEYITVKYIQKSEKGEDYIKLVSQNKHHQDRDIKRSRIKALALVKASVRINSMS
jgi:phage repressor protein C with HTH and peptisase S24 domain